MGSTAARKAVAAKTHELTFGIEIETKGITRRRAAEAIQSVVGGYVRHIGYPGCYDPYEVRGTEDGKTWKVMADSTINDVFSRRSEIVSPILTTADLPKLQEVVRAVRRAGGKVDTSCGIHIHVGADAFTPKGLCNLVKMVYKQQDLLHVGLGVRPGRRCQWARPVENTFLRQIEQRRPRTLDALNRAWYGRSYTTEHPAHYDQSRYHGLNLHNVWFRGTVEFRYFDSTLHAGKVKAYVQFCLGLAAKAIKSRSTRSDRRPLGANAKYEWRCFLLELGLIGDEYKTARLHLLNRFSGDSSRRIAA
jgi:hypothetical protein